MGNRMAEEREVCVRVVCPRKQKAPAVLTGKRVRVRPYFGGVEVTVDRDGTPGETHQYRLPVEFEVEGTDG
jgi:hypothetical protein